MRYALLMAFVAAIAPSVCMAGTLPVRIESRLIIRDLPAPAAATATHALSLTAVNLDAWPETEIAEAMREAAAILTQCGILSAHAELLGVSAPDTHRHFDTPRSRELARALDLPTPVLFFAAGNRQIPAFDGEAIGRGNSRTRPELADTVWIARGARDLSLVIAHELAHVLMDSGAHDNTPRNLMAEFTTPVNTQLTAVQCARILDTGERSGLLRPLVH